MRMTTAVPEALALLSELDCLLDKLTATDLSALPGDELLDFARAWERLKRRGAVVDHAVVVEVQSRHLEADKGLHSTAALLADLLRLDPGQARRRVSDARDFGPRRGLSGEPLEAIRPLTARPLTARALAAGSIGIEHARSVADLFDHIPAQTPEAEAAIETAALDAAAVCAPHRFRQWCVQAAARLDPDGPEPSEDAKQRQRGVSVHDGPDGWAKLSGRLSPHAAAALRAVLGPLSAPAPAEVGTRDQRSAAQRRHDGLEAACTRLLRSGTLPDSGGAATTLLVTIDYRDLLHRYWQHTGQPTSTSATGYGTTSYGTLIPVAELLRRASEAEIIPVVLNDAGGILAYGRTRRLASPSQRRALAARDQGCVRPGCTVPADWCEANHVIPWQSLGPTDIDNLALVCPRDHDQLDRGATIEMIDGVPHWIEPQYLDPRRAPRRNTAHHIPRILQPPEPDPSGPSP